MGVLAGKLNSEQWESSFKLVGGWEVGRWQGAVDRVCVCVCVEGWGGEGGPSLP